MRNPYVFDVSQTDGAELPEHATVKDDVEENRDRLIEFINAQGIELGLTSASRRQWA